MQNLYPVTLTKNDSCLSYALKRTGQFNDYINGVAFLENVKTIPVTSVTTLQRGDILVKISKPRKFASSIDVFGNITKTEATALHFWVYEGDVMTELRYNKAGNYISKINVTKRMEQLLKKCSIVKF